MDWLRQIPIGQYVEVGGSWLQALDPRLKLAWTLAFLLTPILAGPWWRLALVAALTVAAALALCLSWPALVALRSGAPVVIGAKGVERIVQVEFTPDEKAMFDKSVAAVKSLIDATNKIVGRA